MAEEYVQVNVNLTAEDAQKLDQMMMEDAYDNRSAFMRRIVRQEWARRAQNFQAAETLEESVDQAR